MTKFIVEIHKPFNEGKCFEVRTITVEAWDAQDAAHLAAAMEFVAFYGDDFKMFVRKA